MSILPHLVFVRPVAHCNTNSFAYALYVRTAFFQLLCRHELWKASGGVRCVRSDDLPVLSKLTEGLHRLCRLRYVFDYSSYDLMFCNGHSHLCLLSALFCFVLLPTEAPVADIYGSSCEGEPTSTTSLSIDCSNNLEDDDHYLSPYLDGPSAQAARAGGGVTDTATVAVAAVGADPSLNNIATAGADTSNGAADVLRSRKTDAIGTLVAETVSARGICKVNLEKHEKTMSKGALAGIIIGVIVGVALLVAYLHYKIFKEGTYVYMLPLLLVTCRRMCAFAQYRTHILTSCLFFTY